MELPSGHQGGRGRVDFNRVCRDTGDLSRVKLRLASPILPAV